MRGTAAAQFVGNEPLLETEPCPLQEATKEPLSCFRCFASWLPGCREHRHPDRLLSKERTVGPESSQPIISAGK